MKSYQEYIQADPAPLIVNLAPTGMLPTRETSPYVPLQPFEIVQSVREAASIGISMVHLHARDIDASPTCDKEVYARIIYGIREHNPDIVICVSCSGRTFGNLAQRTDVLNLRGELRPDMASLTLSSLNFSRQASINEPDMIRALVEMMIERSIAPEFEVFDLGMANYAKYLTEKLALPGPYYANIILGNVATAQADLLSIAAVANALPSRTVWALGGIGNAQISVTALATVVAPGVRVGLEDNVWMDRKRTMLASNLAMIERIHQLAALADRSVMTSKDLRALLRIENAARSYEMTEAPLT